MQTRRAAGVTSRTDARASTRALPLLSALAHVPTVSAQPAHPGLSAYADAAEVLSAHAGRAVALVAATPPAGREASPTLYWTGIAVDVAGAGAALVIASAVKLSDDGDRGFGAFVGAMTAVLGGVVLALFGADLVYVALGGEPALARALRP